MGCGFSSLKGDDVPNVNNAPTTSTTAETETATGGPARRVNTNFSTIDYDQDSRDRDRRMTEYAPHETVQPKAKHKASHNHDSTATAEQDQLPRGSETNVAAANNNNSELPVQNDHVTAGTGTGTGYSSAHEAKFIDGDHHQLKPYRTLDGGDWDADATTQLQSSQARARLNPHGINGEQQQQQQTSPSQSQDLNFTSSLANDEFTTSNDPANPAYQNSKQRKTPWQKHDNDNNADDADYNEVSGERKKSWLGQKFASFQQIKQGRGVHELSDEELRKYTGKDRAEFDEWAKSQPGVAGNQSAGRIGSDSALASSAPYAIS